MDICVAANFFRMTRHETFLPELPPYALTHHKKPYQNTRSVFLSALAHGAVGMAVNGLPGQSQVGNTVIMFLRDSGIMSFIVLFLLLCKSCSADI